MEEQRLDILPEWRLGVWRDDKYKWSPVLWLKTSLMSLLWVVSDIRSWHCPCSITLELQTRGVMKCSSFPSRWNILVLKSLKMRRVKEMKLSKMFPAEIPFVPYRCECLTDRCPSGDKKLLKPMTKDDMVDGLNIAWIFRLSGGVWAPVSEGLTQEVFLLSGIALCSPSTWPLQNQLHSSIKGMA